MSCDHTPIHVVTHTPNLHWNVSVNTRAPGTTPTAWWWWGYQRAEQEDVFSPAPHEVRWWTSPQWAHEMPTPILTPRARQTAFDGFMTRPKRNTEKKPACVLEHSIWMRLVNLYRELWEWTLILDEWEKAIIHLEVRPFALSGPLVIRWLSKHSYGMQIGNGRGDKESLRGKRKRALDC